MALKKCPECGEMISSTSTQCIHCGYRLRACPECGEWMGPDGEQCPNCGHREAPFKPALYLPHERLKSNRGLLKYLLWNFLTLGIYSLYFFHAISHETNISCAGDGKKTRGLVFHLFITAITFGIYHWVWGYSVSARLAERLQKANVKSPVSGASWFLWSFFGVLLLGIGPLVAQYQLIHALNEVNRHYSQRTAEENITEEQKMLNDISDFYYDSKLHSISNVLSTFNALILVPMGIIAIVLFFQLFNFNIDSDTRYEIFIKMFSMLSCLFSYSYIFSITGLYPDTVKELSPSKNSYWLIGPIVAWRAATFLKGKDTKRHTEFCARFLKELVDGKHPGFPEENEGYGALVLYLAGSYANEKNGYLTKKMLTVILSLVAIVACFLIGFVVVPKVLVRTLSASIFMLSVLAVIIIFCAFGIRYLIIPSEKKMYAWYEKIAKRSEQTPADPPAQAQEAGQTPADLPAQAQTTPQAK